VPRPPDILETARLRLRPSTLRDADAIFRDYAQDYEVTKYLQWMPHRSIEETREFLRRCEKARAGGTRFPWAIIRKQDNRLLGMVEIGLDGHKVTVGYVLARPHWGCGFMTEAAQTVVDWCSSEPSISRIWAFCDVENHASRRVLEKAGMQCEGILRRWIVHPNCGRNPRDCCCYSRVK
jgi:ribosomal-protein-alanine N-acetyltransferase